MIFALVGMLVLGRLVIWTAQTSGPTERLWNLHPTLTSLGECDFCLGFWVYLALTLIFPFEQMWEPFYVPVASEVVTALAASFGVHLARIGWMMQYGVMDLTDD